MCDTQVLNWDMPDEQDIAVENLFRNTIALYQKLADRACRGIVSPDPLPPLVLESGVIVFRDFEVDGERA